MKSPAEITENIEGCKVKLQESRDNEVKFSSVLTEDQHLSYQKTQAYIRGWIDCLEGVSKKGTNAEYESGYKNAGKWSKS